MKKPLIFILVIILLLGAAGFGAWYFFFKKDASSGSKNQNTQTATSNQPANVQPQGVEGRIEMPNIPGSVAQPQRFVPDEMVSSTDLNDPILKAAFSPQVFSSGAVTSASPLSTPPKKPIGASDVDKDGLNADQEAQFGTDPNRSDTDGDGLSDGEEVNTYKTNPKNFDTDGDGLTDGEEVTIQKTDPHKADSDGDGYSDGVEVKGGYNPLGPGKLLR